MAKTKIGSNATYTGNQLGLTIVGDYAYAYNLLSVNNTETSLLKFATGKEILVGSVQFHYAADASDNYLYKVKFNGITIFSFLMGDADAHADPRPIPIVIPPLTEVDCTADNVSSSGSVNMACSLVGRVYA